MRRLNLARAISVPRPIGALNGHWPLPAARPTVSHLSGFRSLACNRRVVIWPPCKPSCLLEPTRLRNQPKPVNSSERVDHLPNNLLATKRSIDSLSEVHLCSCDDYGGSAGELKPTTRGFETRRRPVKR